MEQFQHLHNLNIDSTCRTCLENLNDMHYDIFSIPELVQKYTQCTQLPIETGDGLPTSLCEQCHNKIEDFYNFQQMCKSAKKRFQEIVCLEKKPTPFELAIDPSEIPTNLIFKKEAKGEQEDPFISTDNCLELTNAELNNIKSKDDFTSQEDEESDADVKYPISDEEEHSADDDATKGDIKPNDVKISKSPANPSLDLECKKCKKIFKKLETFTAHMRVHQGLKPFPCHLCDKSYVRKIRLRGHIKMKHETGPRERFSCTVEGCDKTFSMKQSVKKHIKEVHTTEGQKVKQPYICEDCGKVLTSLATLKNHRFQHTGAQLPHECPQCGKRYITKNKLKEHMNRHAGIRNYVCPHCGARKSTRTELKTHINYHTKEKTYPCQFCDMVFNNIGNFSRHRRIVHEGIKDYPCSYCDKSFGKAETRKHHEMTHTGEKPHECNICHKKFIQPVALKKHKKIHFKNVSSGIWEQE